MKKKIMACLLTFAMVLSSVAPVSVNAQELPKDEVLSSDVLEDEASTDDVTTEENVEESSVIEMESEMTESIVQEDTVEVQNQEEINTIGDVKVVGVSIPDYEIMQFTNGWENETWYGDSAESTKWYYYCLENFVWDITVTFSDGYVYQCYDPYGFNYNGQWYSFNFITDQSDTSPWGVGTHTVTVELNGFESTFNVTIVEGQVESFEFINPEVYEGTNGWWTEYYNNDTNSYDYYYHYTLDSLSYKVTLKNGTVLKSQGTGVEYNGEWFYPSYSINQSSDNPLTVGEQTISVSIMGSKVDAAVEIVESPVESFEVEDFELIVGTNCELRENWLENGSYGQYYYYNFDNADFTITFKDGTVVKNEYNARGFYYDGKYYEIGLLTDQSYYNQWTPGNTYTATLAAMGVKEEVTVNMVDCPISSVHFEDVNIIEGMGGEICYSWNDETQMEEEWYRYKLEEYVPEFEIVFEDGTVVNETNGGGWDSESHYFEFDYKGNRCSISAHDIGQSVRNPWTVGTYEIPVTIMGQEFSYNVNIIESPYTELEILNVEVLMENQNGYFNENGDYIYQTPAISFKIHSNDGTFEIMFADCKTEFANNVFEKLKITDTQNENPWTVGGENYFTVEYGGVSAQVPVKIKSEDTFEYIEQNGAAYITGVKAGQQVLEVPEEIDGLPVTGIISLASNSWETNYSVREIIIPDSVVTLSDDFVSSVRAFEKITIGSSVSKISLDMFARCYNLKEIIISDNNPYYCDINGVVYDKAVTTIVVYPMAGKQEYKVPKTVTNIDALNEVAYENLNITFEEGSEAFVTEDDVTYTADMTKIIYCNPAKAGSYEMPSSVTEVARNAFAGCANLTDVKISENVTSVVYGMFMNCSALASIQMPESIESIETSAFQSCGTLETIDLPDSLQRIEKMAFTSSGITSITIPENVKNIGANAFSWSALGGSLVIPDAVEEIGIQAFCNTDITDISVGTGTTSIGNSAFSGTKIAEITIPDNVTYLGESVFNGCDNLKEAYVGSGITAILSNAFSECAALEKVVLANENVSLGEAAFAGTPLKELNFENVKGYIGMAAFAGNDFTSVSLAEGVTGIGYIAFSGCADLDEISMPTSIERVEARSLHTSGWYRKAEKGLNYIDSVLYGYKGEMPEGTEIVVKEGTTVLADAAFEDQKGLTKITLPEGLKTIGNGTFSGCTNLTEINIPASVTNIEQGAFLECSGLEAINVAEGNPMYSSISGVLYSKDGTELIIVPKQNADTFEIPDKVSVIKKWAFGYAGVDKIVITNSGIGIEDKAIGYDMCIGNNRHMVTIEAHEGSSAQQYAIDNLLNFSVLAHEHTWDEGVLTKEGNCKEKGIITYTCTSCSATKEGEGDYGDHVWDTDYTVDVEATCGKPGVKSIHCSLCEELKIETEIPATGEHTWDEGTETKASTCIEKGTMHHECLNCEATKDEEIDYADHAWDELYTVDKEASCSEEGIESIHCGICDTVKEGSQQSIPTTDHMMSEWFVDVAASYSKEGQEKRVCTGCDYEETRAIEKVVATGIVLNKDEVEIFMGHTNTITAFCSPIAHLPGEVVWSSSDNDVAVVDQNGVVKGVAAGTAIIIAKIGIHSAECTVKIIPGEWRQDSTGWWYYKADGSYPRNCWQDIDGEKYYFDSYGYRVENAWQDGYWLDSEGHIVKNAWVDGDRYYVGEDGQYVRNSWIGECYLNAGGMKTTGWSVINGNTYYFATNGKVVTNTWVDKYWLGEDGIMMTNAWVDNDAYYVNANGERLQNSWLKQPEGWYYFGGNGQTCKGWFPIDGIWYMGQREHNGLLLQNEWYKEGTNVYYFVNSCAMATGWQSIGGNDYYFGTSGAMYKNTWAGVYWVDEDGIKITNAWVADGKSYVDANGAKQTGWLKLDGDWYYFGTDGVLQKGWIRVGNTEYYGDKETGRIYEQEWLDDIYYFQAGGAKVTGWYQIDGNYYYFTAGGEKATNRWIGAYWVDADGIMATNTWLNDGKVYVGTSGAKQTGWLSYEGNWYYFGTNGVLQTDWIRVGNIWYYADKETGRIYEQEWLDDTYYFKEGGAMVTGWHLIDGDYYYFSASGAKLTNVWIGNYYLKADGKMAVNEWIGNYYVGADGAWIPGYVR